MSIQLKRSIVGPWTMALPILLMAGCLPGSNNEQSTQELSRGGNASNNSSGNGAARNDGTANTQPGEEPPTEPPMDPNPPGTGTSTACEEAIAAFEACQTQTCIAEQQASQTCYAQYETACAAEMQAFEACAATGTSDCLAEREAYGNCIAALNIDCSVEDQALWTCLEGCNALGEQIAIACQSTNPGDPCSDAYAQLEQCYAGLDCSAQEQAATACGAQIDQLCSSHLQAFESCLQTAQDPESCNVHREAYAQCYEQSGIDCTAEYDALNLCYTQCFPFEEQVSRLCSPPPPPAGDACSLLQAALEACLTAPPAPCGCPDGGHGGGTGPGGGMEPPVPNPSVCDSIVVAIDQVCSASACEGPGR